MYVEPIRDWLSPRHLCDPLRFVGTRCHLHRPDRKVPVSVLARDERLILQAGFIKLFALDRVDDGPRPAREPAHKLELHWPSDDFPGKSPPGVPIIEQRERPWPPEVILGSIVDLLV